MALDDKWTRATMGNAVKVRTTVQQGVTRNHPTGRLSRDTTRGDGTDSDYVRGLKSRTRHMWIIFTRGKLPDG
jgi:hypothetical protein